MIQQGLKVLYALLSFHDIFFKLVQNSTKTQENLLERLQNDS